MRTALSISVLIFMGCTDKDVVARVGGRDVRLTDIAQHRRLTGTSAATDADALEQLVARERLAVEAERLGLASSPAVQARLRAASREVLAQAVIARATEAVTEEKALEWFRQHSEELTVRTIEVSQMVFLAPAGATLQDREAARSRATAAYARLLGGESFAEVARVASEDVATASKGGALGRIREGEIPQDLFERLAGLNPGAHTDPLPGPAGFHLFQLTAAPTAEQPSFDDVKARVLARLRTETERELNSRLEKTVTVKRFAERLGEGKP